VTRSAEGPGDLGDALQAEIDASGWPGWSIKSRTRARFEFWLDGAPAVIVETFIPSGFAIWRSYAEGAEIDNVFVAVRAFFESKS
jgi:hypothetical protein